MTDYFTQNIEGIITRLGYECVHVGIKTDFGRMKVQILIDGKSDAGLGEYDLSGLFERSLDMIE